MIHAADIQKQIADELAIGHLPVVDQERLTNEMSAMLYQRILFALFREIPKQEHEKLKQLISSNLDNEITALVHKHVPDISEVVEKELAIGIREYKEALLLVTQTV